MGSRISIVKASKLGRRWDPSFHTLDKAILPRKAKNLGRLAEILRGISVPSREYLDDSVDGGLLYIRISDIDNGEIKGYTAKRVPKKYAKIRLKGGDILLSVRGSIGKAALVSKSFEGAIPSSQLVILRAFKDIVNREYLFKALSSEVVQTQLDHMKTGAIISYVSITELRKLVVPLPNLRDQLRIVRKIKELERSRAKKTIEREKIERQISQIFKGVIN